jgi:glycosyltransferase involved in cell wall biosynthesis
MSNEQSAAARPIVAIAFPFEDINWLGGSYAINHLLNAHRQLEDPRLRLVLVAPAEMPDLVAGALPELPVWRTPLMSRKSLAYLVRRLVRKALGRDLIMESWLLRRGARAFSHADPLGKGARLPVIGHIADLGVHYFSGLYRPQAGEALKRHIGRHANSVDTVLLLSQAVEDDFQRFYGKTRGRREIVHIVPAVPPRCKAREEEARSRYDLPERFFFLPNKFWVHKNHDVVVEALGMLKARGRSICVACSGMTSDERSPDHFGRLMSRAAQLGVEQEFRILGIIPGEDVAALMRAAVAVLNPSKFEGWGLSVAEAREMGKKVIVSDIPVFREQDPARAAYFPADDSETLADLLIDAHDGFDRDEDDAAQEAEAECHVHHQRAYARAYEEVVLATIQARAQSR